MPMRIELMNLRLATIDTTSSLSLNFSAKLRLNKLSRVADALPVNARSDSLSLAVRSSSFLHPRSFLNGPTTSSFRPSWISSYFLRVITTERKRTWSKARACWRALIYLASA